MAFQDVLDGVEVDAATAEHRPEAELLHQLIQLGHSRATLLEPAGLGNDDVFAVTGGLMSGLRKTSSVGSDWNGNLGSMASDILSQLTCSHVRGSSTLEIRGDDTKVVTPNYLDALGIKILYDALGAVANEAKFRLYRGRVEFPRTETSDRARVYPARSVPGLVQHV